MAKNLDVAQFVYKYGDNNITTPSFGLGENFDICKLLGDKEIYSVGIQGPYGLRFYLNGKLAYVGPTELFELDNVIRITSLYIDEQQSMFLQKIVIDVIYDRGE